MSDPDTERGLYGKYRVERIDGKDKGPYFVLAPNTDPFAVDAIEAYAAACENTHQPLADDLLKWRDAAQELHPEHFPPVQPVPELTESERHDDSARAMGPQLAARADELFATLETITQVIKDLESQHAALPNHPNILNSQALGRIADILRQLGLLT